MKLLVLLLLATACATATPERCIASGSVWWTNDEWKTAHCTVDTTCTELLKARDEALEKERAQLLLILRRNRDEFEDSFGRCWKENCRLRYDENGMLTPDK